MHDGAARRTDFDAAANLDVTAVIGDQANGRRREDDFTFSRRGVQVLLCVEGDVVALGLHQYFAAIGDGADASVLGKCRDTVACMQAHGRAAGHLQVVLRGSVVVATGVMGLGGRGSTDNASLAGEGDQGFTAG